MLNPNPSPGMEGEVQHLNNCLEQEFKAPDHNPTLRNAAARFLRGLNEFLEVAEEREVPPWEYLKELMTQGDEDMPLELLVNSFPFVFRA